MNDKISGVLVAEDCDACRPSDTFPCPKCGGRGYVQKKISLDDFYWLMEKQGIESRKRMNSAYASRKP